MNQTKKYLLFGCMAAVLVTADSFPAFAGDSELYGVSLDQEEQAKAPVALDITAVYGKTARLGSFGPVKDPPPTASRRVRFRGLLPCRRWRA